MRLSGIEILFFSNIFRRTHRKIVIIDQKIAFFGGANIHHNARDWFDIQIRIE
jgi:cardiolipin synthase A/B